jgi:hypothetical protein
MELQPNCREPGEAQFYPAKSLSADPVVDISGFSGEGGAQLISVGSEIFIVWFGDNVPFGITKRVSRRVGGRGLMPLCSRNAQFGHEEVFVR